MFLLHLSTGNLIEVLDVQALFNPCLDSVVGRFHAGEEMQDPEYFKKPTLTFPSGEALPVCWVDAHYRHPKLKAA